MVAACKVEGGPTYEFQLSGEASRMSYTFSDKKVDFGHVLYDQPHSTEIVLYNRGKVNFDFTTLNTMEDPNELSPGGISVTPSSGRILARDNANFKVTFLPGIPGMFSATFEVQVAHFETDVITLTGNAVYPQMTLNLPRDISSTQDLSLSKLDLTTNSSSHHTQETGSAMTMETEIDKMLVTLFATENSSKLFNSQTKPKPRYNQTIDFSMTSMIPISP